MLTDLRHALRTLAHAPMFSLVVVVTLGLGIGANTAIFSLVDELLLRLLPVERPEELVQIDGPGSFSGRTMNDRTFSYPMYRDIRDDNGGRFAWRSLDDAGAIEIVGVVKDSMHGTMREGSAAQNAVRRFVYTPLQQSTEQAQEEPVRALRYE